MVALSSTACLSGSGQIWKKLMARLAVIFLTTRGILHSSQNVADGITSIYRPTYIPAVGDLLRCGSGIKSNRHLAKLKRCGPNLSVIQTFVS